MMIIMQQVSGFSLKLAMPSQTPNAELLGCIIDSKQYGKMTSVKDKKQNTMSISYQLFPAFPNPFNPSTMISYYMPKSGSVKIKIYNILGKEISILVDRYQNIGQHSVRFEPKGLSSGVYFVRLITENYSSTNKIIYSK